MFGSFSKGATAAPALARIHDWTRERFQLGPADTILVTELACTLQGCPPLETVVAFWTPDGQRHQFKIFKRADQVLPDDLPYAWMKRALAVPEGFSDDCC
jgi:hypothetical protein